MLGENPADRGARVVDPVLVDEHLGGEEPLLEHALDDPRADALRLRGDLGKLLVDLTLAFDVGPGDVVSGPPGLRGSHEWEVKESLQILTIKATNDPERAIQFNFDKATMDSSATLEYLVARGAADMKESFY